MIGIAKHEEQQKMKLRLKTDDAHQAAQEQQNGQADGSKSPSSKTSSQAAKDTAHAHKYEDDGYIVATIGERFAADILDALIIEFLALASGIAAFYFNVGKPPESSKTIGALSPVLYIFYEAYFLAHSGATPGKKHLNLEVQRFHDNISFFRAVCRVVAERFSLALCGLGYGIALFNHKHKTLHDYICGTVVCRTASFKRRGLVLFLNTLGLLFIVLPIVAWPGLKKKLEMVEQRRCMRRLSLLNYGLMSYVEDNGSLPDKSGFKGLQQIQLYVPFDSGAYICPERAPKGKDSSLSEKTCSYVYLGPISLKDYAPVTNIPLFMEKPSQHSHHLNVLFANGTCMGYRITKKDQAIDTLKELLKKAKLSKKDTKHMLKVYKDSLDS